MTIQTPVKHLETLIKKLVPMIAYTQMQITDLTDDEVMVRMPFIPENKNHLNSMYFGSLSVGADVAGGALALYHAEKSGKKVTIVFKDFQAKFLKRPEEDVLFVCRDGQAVAALVATALREGQRQNLPVHIEAQAASTQDVVAQFVLTLSVK